MKVLKIICCFFFLFISFLGGIKAQAQSAIEEKKVSLEFQNVPLKDVLDEISRQVDVKFSYSKKRIPVNQQVSISVQEELLDNVLKELFKDLKISFVLVEEQIVLQPVKEAKTEKTAEQKKHTLSGYIRDAETGEILIGAAILVKELAGGTVSNAYGFFSLTLPENTYTLRVSFLGFDSKETILELQKNHQLDIDLKPGVALLDEIVVDSKLNLGIAELSKVASIGFSPEEVEEMPALFGEEEVLKSIQSLPGIKPHSDGSTLFHVRGGEGDQNLILVDDAPIYNPSHTLGIFSTIIPEAVKDISIYKGNMPASYGGRLSSVVDIRTKEGNLKKFSFFGGIGLTSLNLGVEGPIKKEKSSYFLSWRKSHLKGYIQAANPEVSDFGFYDLNIKLNLKSSDKNRYYWSFYSGEDKFIEKETSGLSWGNVASSIRWNHVFNDRLFANTTLYSSKYDYYLITSLQNKDQWNSHIANLSLKTDLTWFPDLNNTTSFGMEIRGHNFNPGNYEKGGGGIPPGVRQIAKRFTRELVLYGANEQQLNKRLQLQYGLRLTRWENVGESFEYTFDENYNMKDSLHYDKGKSYHQYINVEPRFAAIYELDSLSTLTFNYTRTTQNVHMISSSISPFTNLEVWLPSGPNIKPQKADVVELGYFRYIAKRRISVGADLYYKVMRNQIAYTPHARLLLNPYLESELRFGKTKAYGLELYVKKEAGRFNGWIGYSLSRAIRHVPELNQGKAYPARYDRPHELDVFASYQLGMRFNLSANWMLSSGNAVTTPSGFYQYNGYAVPLYQQLHNTRMPMYHRLDLSAHLNLKKKPGKFEHSLEFSLYNLYMRKNPIFVNYNKILDENGKILVPADRSDKPELISTKTYLFSLVPSISYHFRL